jgi:predicted transcriptional regulator of viral defense system
MKSTAALRELSEITAWQWGMVTTAQAAARGVTRLQLARLADDGHLERLGHGIYRHTAVPSDRLDRLRAAWLSINPKQTAEQRTVARSNDAVVSGATASYLLGLGDLVPEPYEFTVPHRRQTQRDELTFRIRDLPASDVTLREGLPVTTPERTIADLIEGHMDLSLVADVLADADVIDRDHLAELLAPLAARRGYRNGDGIAFRDELERLAHRHADSLTSSSKGG